MGYLLIGYEQDGLLEFGNGSWKRSYAWRHIARYRELCTSYFVFLEAKVIYLKGGL